MKLSLLLSSLSSVDTLKVFVESVAAEISSYVNLSEKRGTSVPVQLTEDCSGQIGADELNVLMDAYLSGALNEGEFSYILDALSLTQKVKFSSIEVRNLILDLADEPGDRKNVLGLKRKLNARQ